MEMNDGEMKELMRGINCTWSITTGLLYIAPSHFAEPTSSRLSINQLELTILE